MIQVKLGVRSSLGEVLQVDFKVGLCSPYCFLSLAELSSVLVV